MHNKELLMVGEGESSVIISVAKYGSMYTGYNSHMMGNINKIPYWGDTFHYLSGIYISSSVSHIEFGMDMNPSEVYSFKISIPTINFVDSPIEGMDDAHYFFNKNLTWEPNTQHAIYFDPPPDGYLDPKTLEPI